MRLCHSFLTTLALVSLSFATGASTEETDDKTKSVDIPSEVTLFKNIRVFNGVEDMLHDVDVLVVKNIIHKVAKNIPTTGTWEIDVRTERAKRREDLAGGLFGGYAFTTISEGKNETIEVKVNVIDGGGRTLMPGMIDGHAHLTLVGSPNQVANDWHWGYLSAVVGREAAAMLMRGFTTIRDAGGPSYGIARAIDEGVAIGPRIYPSGHFIGQTSGHSDFRSFNESHTRDRSSRNAFETHWAFMADGRDEVLAYARETLRRGATQIKLSVGGGVASAFDPLDTAQFTVDEIKAAMDAAEDWNTYVFVHAYTDRSVMRALKAGVKSIDHGTLIQDPATMIAMREANAIFNPQALIFSPSPEALAELPEAIAAKGAPMVEGVDVSMRLAKEHGVKIAFGVDSFGSPAALAKQNEELAVRLRWFTPYEILIQATSNTADLVAMSGPRNPYPEGPLGVIAEGAYADILLVEGNPLEDISVLVDYEDKIDLIMKEGKIYKNTLPRQ
jgi:imidazolonepropionase-like amidohydrolase